MGPRIIDIDILLMDDLIYHRHGNHSASAFAERRFVLTPLAEIAA